MKILFSLIFLLSGILCFLLAIGFYQPVVKCIRVCRKRRKAKLVDYEILEIPSHEKILTYSKPVYKVKINNQYIFVTSKYRYTTLPLDVGEIVTLYYNPHNINEIFVPEERNISLIAGLCCMLGIISIIVAVLLIITL